MWSFPHSRGMETETVGRSGLERVAASLRQGLAELRRRDGRLSAVGAFQFGLLALFLVGLAVDPRTVGGEPVWLKPAKFAASLTAFLWALAWLGHHLPVPEATKRRVSWAVAVAAVVEIVLIGGQAARGVESHFNVGTPLDAAIFYTMGVGVLFLTLPVGWLAWRARGRSSTTHPAFAAGIRAGILIFFVGAFEGVAMLALSGSTVGGGWTLPGLGWTLTGDFRVAHFVGLHALQALPLTGYLAAHAADRGRLARPVRVVQAVSALHTAVLLFAVGVAVWPLA